jgi:hypothetical protein
MGTFDPNIGERTRWKRGQASPNPGGRPKTRALSEALRTKLAEVKRDDPEGRTYVEVLAANLITLACSQGRNAVAAAAEIANRIEGRVHERVEVSFTEQLNERSDAELEFYIAHGFWPNDEAQRQ